MECTTDAGCREGEACKWFDNGRYCGLVGTGVAGGSCTFFEDCGEQRVCAGFTGGYCARLGCGSDADCESNSVCALAPLGDGVDMCVRRCGGTEPQCRIAENYACSTVNLVAGGSAQACVK